MSSILWRLVGISLTQNELLSTQLPSRSQVSHRQYYKLTRNSINEGRTTWAAPTGVLPRGRSRGRSVALEWIRAHGYAGALLRERSLMQRAPGHSILWRWISHKRYDIHYRQFQWNTNRDLHTPHSTVSFRMTLSDLEWLSKIFNDTKRARSICDSWGSCFGRSTRLTAISQWRCRLCAACVRAHSGPYSLRRAYQFHILVLEKLNIHMIYCRSVLKVSVRRLSVIV